MNFSIIVLAENWFEDTPDFLQELHDFFSRRNESFEILIMANGAGSNLRNSLARLNIPEDRLKAFEFNTRNPQAVCLKTALKESRGEILVITESYKQISMDSFDALISALDEETDVVCPWRQARVDTPSNQFQSKIFNSLVRTASKSHLHDLSCTVKILKREVLENTVLYGRMYRFLPILAEQKGYKNREIPCEHFQQKGLSGVHTFPRYFNVIIDLMILYFNTRFSRKPLRFFSILGVLLTFIGVLFLGVVFFEKLVMNHPIGGRPVLLLSIFFAVTGAQVACVGLLGEIIAFTQGRTTKEYSVETEI